MLCKSSRYASSLQWIKCLYSDGSGQNHLAFLRSWNALIINVGHKQHLTIVIAVQKLPWGRPPVVAKNSARCFFRWGSWKSKLDIHILCSVFYKYESSHFGPSKFRRPFEMWSFHTFCSARNGRNPCWSCSLMKTGLSCLMLVTMLLVAQLELIALVT